MPLYLTQFAYTPEAWAALARDPADRAAAIAAECARYGCRLRELFYCFGDYDGLVIVEAPDEAAAAAVLIGAVAAGHLRAMKTTALLEPAQAEAAMRRAGELGYQGPGRAAG
jgi:uncharacterized protein with GYD domain